MSGDWIESDIPIVRVTLLEDRARLLRRSTFDLPKGIVRCRIRGVSPALVDKTLTARIDGAGDVIDAHVLRRLEIEKSDAGAEGGSLAQLRAEGEGLDAKIAELLDRKLLLERRATGLDETASLALDELAEDVSWGRDIDGNWDKRLERLSQSERELREQTLDLSEQLTELYAKHDRLGARLAMLEGGVRLEVAELELVVESDGGAVTIEAEYTVPAACWRPYHLATLAPEQKAVTIRTDACVWQNTGEDWTDVELCFSTERPSLGTSVPDLEDDLLTVHRKSSQVRVEAREVEVQTTGLGSSTAMVSMDVPGVDDGGELVRLVAPQAASIPSDGRAHRITLSSFEAAVEAELVAVPELSPCVFLRTVQTSEAATPLLAGPVDLIRDSGLVGRTSILYVAPGERFELGWGPEAELRVKRMDESLREKARMLSSWVTSGHKIEILLSNLGDQSRRVRMKERVPVSETDKVKIAVDSKESSPGTEVDEQGFIEWVVEVPAFERASRVLRYMVRKHEDVVGI